MSDTTTKQARPYRTPVAYAHAEVSLDDFSVEDIIDYLKHIGELPAYAHSGDRNEEPEHDIESLYYATRGEGSIAGPIADQIRALLRDIANRIV